jgi:hypothetical protein
MADIWIDRDAIIQVHMKPRAFEILSYI